MSIDEHARRSSTHLAEDHDELDIINFTGGEPTLHPQLPEFLADVPRRRASAA